MDGVSFILMPASATTATASPPVTAAVAAAANPTAAASAAAAHLSWRPTPRDSPLLSLSTYDSIHSRASSPSFRPSPKLRTATPPVLPMLLPFHSPSSSSPSRSQPQTPASFHYPHHQYYTTSHPSTPSSATCPDYHPATPSKLASSSLLLTSISPSPPPLPPPSSTDTHSYIHNYATPNTPASNPTSTTNSPRFNHSSPRSSIFQYPASVPMTPSSSMGLPSPTFPPRKLSSLQPPAPPPPSASASGGGSVPMTPTHLSHVHSPRTLSPIVPPRSPARMPSVVAVSGGGVMTTPSSAASSRRNSWQVSLRLASSRAAGAGRRRGSILFGGRGSFSRSVSRRSLKGSVVGLDVGEGEGDAEGEGENVVIPFIESVLQEGDVLGEGCELNGEVIRCVSVSGCVGDGSGSRNGSGGMTSPPRGAKFEVVRKLGTGSYAVVFLVREVVSGLKEETTTTPTPTYGGEDVFLFDENECKRGESGRKYGREFAIKCLSRANLSSADLEVQMYEAQIHHSIGPHPNIVTLHQTLETPSYLLLVLEYVPGEDLFYFLEQSRDGHSSVTAAAGSPRSQSNTNSNCHSGCESSHSSGGSTPLSSVGLSLGEDLGCMSQKSVSGDGGIPVPICMDAGGDGDSDSDEMGTGMVNTPPTPSLLSSVRPGVMFSQARLKLVASMFKQMCDAVQACHSRGIAHRDIKPENFIVTKAVVPTSSQLPAAAAAAESLNEQRVVVKLSDFGLATVERESADVDCGSAPYMSFECRNNVGPTYTTQPADVWSLGIVLINMLYHHNLWQDPCLSDPAFEEYLSRPVPFLLQRCPGMTRHVAEFLANKVFWVSPGALGLEEPGVDGHSGDRGGRVSAGDLGEWVKGLPAMFGAGPLGAAVATAGDSMPALEKPRSSDHVLRDAQHQFDYAEEDDGGGDVTIRPRDDQVDDETFDAASVAEEEDAGATQQQIFLQQDMEAEPELDSTSSQRVSSGVRQRRRGARRNRGASVTPSTVPSTVSSPFLAPTTLPPPSSFILSTSPLQSASSPSEDQLEYLRNEAQILARRLSRKQPPRSRTVVKEGDKQQQQVSVVTALPVPNPTPITTPTPLPITSSLPPLPASVPSPPPRPVPTLRKKTSKWNVFGRKDTPASASSPALASPPVNKKGGKKDPSVEVVENMIFALASPSSSTSVDSWRVRNASTEAVETIDKPLGSLWRQRPDARRGPAPNPSPSFASPNWRHHPPPPHSSSSMTALSQSPITPQTPQFIMASTSSSPHHNSNYASSIYSTAGTSMKSSGSSTFTRFSNASVSTFATTVSASSGFSLGGGVGVLGGMGAGSSNGSASVVAEKLSGKGKKSAEVGPLPEPRSTPVSVPARPVVTRPLPRNVKPLQGVPWLLGEPPQRTNGKKSEGDVRRRKAQPSNLDPISERPKKWSGGGARGGGRGGVRISAGGGSGSGSESEGESSAAATLSTTAATTAAGSSSAGTVGQQQRQGQTQQAQSSSQSQSQSSSGGVPKKVQKGQIATLAKVLSSIRRKD